ncbi:unnamed protein product [Albugo candida]|uniref:Uncharacterized protein n=1 Tax=Albugo candida TaxID=65357 RepID=A0A024G772_9STRA|nr:unnamed protein product [Albugo candida]|eukprot:CCI42603.1 unnamed protein product [Albugo candida]
MAIRTLSSSSCFSSTVKSIDFKQFFVKEQWPFPSTLIIRHSHFFPFTQTAPLYDQNKNHRLVYSTVSHTYYTTALYWPKLIDLESLYYLQIRPVVATYSFSVILIPFCSIISLTSEAFLRFPLAAYAQSREAKVRNFVNVFSSMSFCAGMLSISLNKSNSPSTKLSSLLD